MTAQVTDVSSDTLVILEKLRHVTDDIAELKVEIQKLNEIATLVAVLRTRMEQVERSLTILVGAFVTAAGGVFIYLLTHGGKIIP